MTRRSPSAEDLLREMRSSVVPVDSPEHVHDRRIRTVSLLRAAQTRELQHRGAARIRRRIVVTASALAALAAGIAMYQGHRLGPVSGSPVATVFSEATTVRALGGHIVVVHGGRESEQAPGIGASLATGDAVRTSAESRASMTMQNRAAVEVGLSTIVGLGTPERSHAERLDLELGRVDVSVPKLEPGQSLCVHTPHATVTVHGTRFSVAVASDARSALRTTVEVREGAVWVEHDGRTTELSSGDVWSSDGATTRAPESLAGSADEARKPASKAEPRIPSIPSAKPNSRHQGDVTAISEGTRSSSTTEFESAATSTLSEENALLLRAMVASRNGDDKNAVAILDRLLTRFPHSVLKENAQAERLRAIKRLEPANAPPP
jgi:hypothetical protein